MSLSPPCLFMSEHAKFRDFLNNIVSMYVVCNEVTHTQSHSVTDYE
jgi:hypothetical protein